MNTLKTLLASAVLAASAAGANAATYTADTLVSATAGACTGTVSGCAEDDRQNTANAVDGNASTFYSLGLGGSIVVGFSEIVGNIMPSAVSVFEVTFKRSSGHKEAARRLRDRRIRRRKPAGPHHQQDRRELGLRNRGLQVHQARGRDDRRVPDQHQLRRL